MALRQPPPMRGNKARGQGNVTAIASHGPTARSSDAIETTAPWDIASGISARLPVIEAVH